MTLSFAINASDYGVTTTGDSTSAAQSAIDAAFTSGPPRVVFPTGFNFTKLATYPGITLEGNGDRCPWVRTAAGPGLYTAISPSCLGYPATVVNDVILRNITLNDGTGLAGANLTLCEAQGFLLDNVRSFSSLAGAEFTGWASTSNYVTSLVANNGTLAAGMQIIGPGCLRTSGDNTYPTLLSVESGNTWNSSGYTPAASSREMVGVVPWTWGLATPSTWVAGQHNLTLPSASVIFLGGCGDGTAINLYAGGKTTISGTATVPSTYSGIGILMDTLQKDGGNKPNHITLISPQLWCCNLALGGLNGSDHLVLAAETEFSNYGMLFGTGQSSALRNVVTQPYFEGYSVGQMQVAIGLGPNAYWNQATGAGSLSYVTTPKVDYGSNNSWTELH